MEMKDTLSSCSNSEAQQMQQIQDKAKKSCMISFRQLHLHLKRLSQNDLQGTRTESGFKRAFATLSGQDIETFTGTMFLNAEQLEKQLDKEDFQEIGFMAAFNVLDTQFQMFITSRLYLDDEYSIDERAQHKREYDSWVNERQMQTTEEKVDTSKALDARLVDTESSGTESKERDTSSRSENDAHDDDADIRPIYDEESMAKSQFLKEKSNEAKVKHEKDVLETINIELEHKVAKLLKENETLKKHYKELFDSIKITRAKTIEHTTSLIATNDKFKAQLQEKGFAIAALKNELRKLKGNSVNTKFAKQSILGKPMLQSHRNQSVVRKLTAFMFERPRISKPRCDSQVDVNYDLISSKNMLRFSSNDMVHNHYLEEAKKETQERSRNLEPSLMPSAISQNTANGSKPKPRINNQTSRNWPASKSSCITTKPMPIAEHSRNSRNFFDSKHFVYSTCQQCVFIANHDSCLTKFLKEVNSHAKVSIQKTSVVQKKTMTPRSCLRWKSTGRNFKTVGLRWIHTGKIFAPSITKVDSEPPNGSNADISNQYECEQTLDVSAGALNLSACTSFNPKEEGLRVCSELRIHDRNNESTSSKLVPKVVPQADKTATSRQELELQFHHHITMLRSYALSWKPCQGDSLNLPDHRIRRRCCSLIPLKSDSSSHAHAQTIKTY
uniref:Integrase, catalytic region, zinc finger, CCHC-type, peptidase aspartic, catalytic n=1 Tax=Tanacetum cinerariifolium TaxID=118510 RepID=A0A6L2MEH3_TANCI|nr:hypothetical protein [Tanacetum cinerariifolium]